MLSSLLCISLTIAQVSVFFVSIHLVQGLFLSGSAFLQVWDHPVLYPSRVTTSATPIVKVEESRAFHIALLGNVFLCIRKVLCKFD
jgi:hypothetical protein